MRYFDFSHDEGDDTERVVPLDTMFRRGKVVGPVEEPDDDEDQDQG